jgi:Retrotransposon gag protein
MQSCEPDISVALQNHQKQVAEFSTWDNFSHHMKATYGSQEMGFQRLLRLNNEKSVEEYYRTSSTLMNLTLREI